MGLIILRAMKPFLFLRKEKPMRLAAQAKMGYYPTPESVTPIIIKYLQKKKKGLIRILDPCAGEGTAIELIGDHLQAETYGIEIDLERGKKAKEVLTRCLVTDYQDMKINSCSLPLLGFFKVSLRS